MTSGRQLHEPSLTLGPSPGGRGKQSSSASQESSGQNLPSPPGRGTGGEGRATKRKLHLIALSGIPLIHKGDDLAQLILDALLHSGEQLVSGDVLVLAQKIVSKARGCQVDLATVTPSPRALELAKVVDKDPRVIELILSESSEVLRARRDVIVVVHRLGFVMANAGIDFSNVEGNEQESRALLLPRDPDGECRQLRETLKQHTGVEVGVIINDSHGRAWRNGTVGVAIGVAGIPGLHDLRGKPDLFGRALRITQVGHADELASAASLLMGQAAEGRPIVLIRGLPADARDGRASELVRPKEMDLFR
jgi:coenzyme F420-0:L-glutamate ligase / coenzyme F420-1:gamma-L-glutamate ligase